MQVQRPQLSEDRRKELEAFLLAQWERAVQARQTQIDGKYSDWSKNYYGVPAEATRTVPWYKSSNFVVKIVRLFVETFQARTLNIIFATKPLITVKNFPRDLSDGLQYYLDHKAINEWNFYDLSSRMLSRGAKNGTVVTKVNYVEDIVQDVDNQTGKNSPVVNYEGPRPRVIPYDDIYLYPHTACDMSEVEITFHRVRFTREMAERKAEEGKWQLTDDDVKLAAKLPRDIKRTDENQEAGIYDRQLEEVTTVECHLNYPITNDTSRYYSIVGVICPEIRKLIDVYHNPNPGNYPSFYLYTPSPREDCIYGESWSEILAQAQEEISQIHNDRRNSSFLASAPVFKRRNGSMLPNPSTNWYPGKVFDLESMEDLEVVTLGRDTGDMIQEELHVLALAERLMGIGPIMQGASQGGQDRKNVYNTGGTLAVLSESNGRQDTNIRDARMVIGDIAKCCYFLQSHFNPQDPALEFMPPQVQEAVRKAFDITNRDRIRSTKFEIKASSAGANREVEKASLLQMANFLGQHSQTLLSITPQAIGAQNPTLQGMMMSIMEMSSWMAKRILAAFDESEAEGELPDVQQLFSAGQPKPTGGAQAALPTASPGGMEPPGATGTGGALTPAVLQQISQLGSANGGSRPA